MEKRLVVAIALSMIVLLAWQKLFVKTQPIDNKAVITQTLTAEPAAKTEIASPAVVSETLPVEPLRLNKGDSELAFVEDWAAIKEATFTKQKDAKFFLKNGFLIRDALSFHKTTLTPVEAGFVHADQIKRITKKFFYPNPNHIIELEIKVENLSSEPLRWKLPLILGSLDFSAQNIQARFQDVVISGKDTNKNLNARKKLEVHEIKFLGMRDRYFCAIIEPVNKQYTGFISVLNSKESEVGLISPELVVLPGQSTVEKFRIYLGPQELRSINSLNSEWAAIMNFGTFDFIAQILLQCLEFLFKIVHNWGWAIVILSLLVYLLLFPLTLKQMRSMKEMQALQPRIEALRAQYKDKPQQLNKEIMGLYKEHKVNPFGGCLPLLLQMPIFLALYQVLMRSVFLKGANFLWIKDLSEPDRLFLLPVSIPVLGNEINILPIIMAVGMFIQQKISMVNTGGSSAEQQKIMLVMMPVIFGIIFYHMPAGLVLYWFINSALMLIYQIRIKHTP